MTAPAASLAALTGAGYTTLGAIMWIASGLAALAAAGLWLRTAITDTRERNARRKWLAAKAAQAARADAWPGPARREGRHRTGPFSAVASQDETLRSAGKWGEPR